VRWPVVREILLAWVVTMPGCAAMAAALAAVEGVLS
jgi:phosphate/sulfate permease